MILFTLFFQVSFYECSQRFDVDVENSDCDDSRLYGIFQQSLLDLDQFDDERLIHDKCDDEIFE
jgi:hypothetical protein